MALNKQNFLYGRRKAKPIHLFGKPEQFRVHKTTAAAKTVLATVLAKSS